MSSAYSIYTNQPAPEPKKGKRKFSIGRKTRNGLIAGGIAIVIIGAVTYGALRYQSYKQAQLIASLKADPDKIRQAVDAGQISRGEAREAMRASWEQRMDKQMDEYFAQKTQKDRLAYIDKMIDEMEKRRKEWESRAATRPARTEAASRPTSRPTTRPGGDQRRNDPQRQMARVQGGNPVRQAQRAEFFAAMRARMQQRGIQPPGGGRGGWGGGFGGGSRGPGGGGGR